jgi:two-component system, chemotaxis family, sensor kinase CheA
MAEDKVVSKKISEQFHKEARERLKDIERGLLNLEQDMDLKEQVRLIFRGFHGLKGIAGYVDARDIIDISNAGESLLTQIRDSGITFRQDWIDLLLKIHDDLQGLLDRFDDEKKLAVRWTDRLQQLNAIVDRNRSYQCAEPPSEEATKLFLDTADAQLGGLDQFLSKWNPGIPDPRLLAAVKRKLKLFTKGAAKAGITDVDGLVGPALILLDKRQQDSWNRDEIRDFCGISDRLRSITKATNIAASPAPGTGAAIEAAASQETSERRIDIKAAYVEMLEALVSDFTVYAHRVSHDLDGMKPMIKQRAHPWLQGMESDLKRFANAFAQSCRRLHLVPLSSLFERFPRLVRDIAKREGKTVEMVVKGQETELEKDQVEKLAEPLVHLVRNAADHGLETPEERRKSGKSEIGVISLEALQVKHTVTIRIADDGRGIDFDGIRDKAVKLGLMTREKAVSLLPEELMDLIFLSGLSTTEIANTISGRGVGMDIVQQSVKELDGRIELESEPGKGTTFILTVPLNLDA